VEGFLTPSGLGLVPALTIGLALGATYWALVAWRGIRRPVTDELELSL
jgi:hypothetical protein